MSWQVEFRSPYAGKGIVLNLNTNDEQFLDNQSDLFSKGIAVRDQRARIFSDSSAVYIEATNPGSLKLNGQALSTASPLSEGDWVALGYVPFQVKVSRTSPKIADGATIRRGHEEPGHFRRPIRIGRQSNCDFVIDSPLVSRQHAEIHTENEAVVLRDLGSTNGTYVNARRVQEPIPLRRRDRIEIATFAFVFTGESLEPIDSAGRVHVETHGLSKEIRDRATRKSKQLLQDIDLVVEPGEFVAIFGTSGSGKSTLLDALNGRRPASSGRVLYNGIDLYPAFDLFRSSIGYVPQQDIVHRRISIQNALRYTARLRLPGDTQDEEIDRHIARVLHQVGLSDKAANPIDTPSPLSGGQLKRVSLAVELIANPNILFLDEVTSGLDAGTDKKMMQLFAELASEQKTVICVTHTLENIDVCHFVLLLHHGRMIYFGPPNGARQHFGVQRLSDVYDLIETRPAEQWAEHYQQSSYHSTYITERRAQSDPAEMTQQTLLLQTEKSRREWFKGAHLFTLMRRYADLLVADRRNLAILLLQAPLIATLVGLVFDASVPLPQRAATESQISFILVISAIWCGCLNSTREIVKELPIYLRERSVGLGIGPYLLSKLVPLSILCLLQCISLLGIVTLLASWSGDFLTRLGALFATGMAATTMGLAVSTLVDTNDKAVGVVPILLIPQVILSNFMVQLGKAGKIVAQTFIIAFSSFDAMKATMAPDLALFVQTQHSFWADIGTMMALWFAFLLASLLGLKIRDKRS
jgi:ABC transport system ATP-binding/permease protein